VRTSEGDAAGGQRQRNLHDIFVLPAKSLCYRTFMVSVSDDDSAEFLPSLRRRQSVGDTDTHSLLVPLADAADAIARLEASVVAVSPAVAEGLRARSPIGRQPGGWRMPTPGFIPAISPCAMPA
jgi:hypothetical protein